MRKYLIGSVLAIFGLSMSIAGAQSSSSTVPDYCVPFEVYQLNHSGSLAFTKPDYVARCKSANAKFTERFEYFVQHYRVPFPAWQMRRHYEVDRDEGFLRQDYVEYFAKKHGLTNCATIYSKDPAYKTPSSYLSAIKLDPDYARTRLKYGERFEPKAGEQCPAKYLAIGVKNDNWGVIKGQEWKHAAHIQSTSGVIPNLPSYWWHIQPDGSYFCFWPGSWNWVAHPEGPPNCTKQIIGNNDVDGKPAGFDPLTQTAGNGCTIPIPRKGTADYIAYPNPYTWVKNQYQSNNRSSCTYADGRPIAGQPGGDTELRAAPGAAGQIVVGGLVETTDALRMRRAPTASGDNTIMTLPKGARGVVAEIVRSKENGSVWAYVYYNDTKRGYSSALYLKGLQGPVGEAVEVGGDPADDSLTTQNPDPVVLPPPPPSAVLPPPPPSIVLPPPPPTTFAPPPPPAPIVRSNKFVLNDRVAVDTSGSVNVRALPGGNRVGSQSEGALGRITGGPEGSGEYIWWYVNYDSGVDGWSVEDFLRKAGTESSGPGGGNVTNPGTAPASVSTCSGPNTYQPQGSTVSSAGNVFCWNGVKVNLCGKPIGSAPSGWTAPTTSTICTQALRVGEYIQPPANGNAYVLHEVLNVPPSLNPGQKARVQVSLMNCTVQGKCGGLNTWRKDGANAYRIGFLDWRNYRTVGGAILPTEGYEGWGVSRVNLPHDVAPGGSVVVDFEITAPMREDTYSLAPTLLQENKEWIVYATPAGGGQRSSSHISTGSMYINVGPGKGDFSQAHYPACPAGYEEIGPNTIGWSGLSHNGWWRQFKARDGQGVPPMVQPGERLKFCAVNKEIKYNTDRNGVTSPKSLRMHIGGDSANCEGLGGLRNVTFIPPSDSKLPTYYFEGGSKSVSWGLNGRDLPAVGVYLFEGDYMGDQACEYGFGWGYTNDEAYLRATGPSDFRIPSVGPYITPPPPPSPVTPPPPPPPAPATSSGGATIGFHDTATCERIEGWACTPGSDSFASVSFFDGPRVAGSQPFTTIAANGWREAAVGTTCGSTANKGFALPTPNSLKDGDAHYIHAYVTQLDGSMTLLGGSPRTLICELAKGSTASSIANTLQGLRSTLLDLQKMIGN